MSAFADLHVSLGDPTPPRRGRLGSSWQQLTITPRSVWVGQASSERSDPLVSAAAPGWRIWANGPVFSYRHDDIGPIQRFAMDLANGCADPALLDMHAVVFGWDESTQQMSVWTNRMGTVHAYVGGRPGYAAVGTYLAAVAERSNRDLDWIGITGFCGFGFYPGDRTMFEDVRILRPATCSVFDDQGTLVEQSRYWNWWYEPDHSRCDDDLLDEFDETWTRTVRAQCAGTHSVVPLSGGLDSRTVFAVAAPRNGAVTNPVRTLTYGYDADSIEIGISQRVAATRGQSALEVVVGPYLLDRMSDVVDAVECFQGLAFSRQAGVSTELAGLGDHVVGGHWGDVWFDVAGCPTGESSDLTSIAHRKFAKQGREWLLSRLCTPNLDDPPGEVLRQVLAEELARIPDLGDPDMRLKALKTEQWSFRWTLASVRAYQLAVPTLLPFYANDVVDFFLRVPTERLPGRRLQTAYLRRHHRDLARITWQDSGMSLLQLPWEPTASLIRRAASKARRTIRRMSVIERNWEVQYLSDGMPGRVRALVLDPDVASAQPPYNDIREFLDAFFAAPDSGQGYAVDALLTVRQATGLDLT